MIVAVDQPNYIPWKGYFDLIHDVDLFVFYNDVQYTVRDWRNRNKIITPNGEKWLSVPCGKDTRRLICEVQISDREWQKNHYETIRFAYGKCPFYDWLDPFLRDVYLYHEWKYLYELDIYMTEHISKEFLGIETRFADSREYSTSGVKHERMLNLLQSIGTDVYESGPAAKDYIIGDDYKKKNIELRWKSYEGYPIYRQKSHNFNHYVSVIDLLLMLVRMLHIIYGDGEKKLEQYHGRANKNGIR
jgi:hypothetical protein